MIDPLLPALRFAEERGSKVLFQTMGGVAAEGLPCPLSPSDRVAAGQMAVYMVGIDPPKRTISVDPIQFLTGESAKTAFHLAHPEQTQPPPNDYHIVNSSPRDRTFPISKSVEVQLVRLGTDQNPDLSPGTFKELPTYLSAFSPQGEAKAGDPFFHLSSNPFWLTIREGEVTAIEEQYVP